MWGASSGLKESCWVEAGWRGTPRLVGHARCFSARGISSPPAFSEPRSRLPEVVAATLEVRDARCVAPSIDQGPLSRLGPRGRSVTAHNFHFVRKVPTPEGRGVIVCKIAVEKIITLSNVVM